MTYQFEKDAAAKVAENADWKKLFAQLHAVFVHDNRAKELLEFWQQTARYCVPVNATVQEYAAAQAVRAFVQVIEEQIALAQKGGF